MSETGASQSGSSKSYVTMNEFIDIAIQFENESAAFYKELQNEEGLGEKEKELLKRLENEELDHAAGLKGFAFDRESEETIQFTPELEPTMPPAPKQNDLDSFFEVALEREKKSARIYEFASDFAVGKFKQFLVSLADFEKAHERYIRKIRQDFKRK